MSGEDKTQSRLSRWSERKLAVAKESEEIKTQGVVEEDAEAAAALAAEHETNRLAAEAVDLETLDEDTDFSVFMKDGVPELLKKSAMAVLWRTNPIFANVDGLVDYDDDFGSPDLIMKTFESAYQVGKGYLDKIEEDDEKPDQLADKYPVEADDVVSEEDPIDEEVVADEDEEAEMETVETLETETPVDIDGSEFIEEEAPHPKVSLRHRLMLDS
ncbi:MAG: DUF3306 domain-containing protein [Rhizobiaceae bacterium]|nr:DUF3306 domain-containing protein [Rhizobiaceae bacterium]